MSKKTTYITDVQDTFDKPRATKEALKLSQEIKQAQQQAHPSKDFKESLLTRLENIYSLEQADEAPSRFSIFQLMGVFCSFALIAGTVFMFFDIRENTDNILQGSMMSEEKTQKAMLQSENPDNSSDLPLQEEADLSLNSELRENIEQAIGNEDVHSEKKIEQAEGDTSMPSNASAYNADVQEPEREHDPAVEIESNMMLKSSQMFRGALPGKPDELSDEEKFQETCDIYGGTLSDDKQECIFKNGIHCDYESTLADSEHPCEAIYWTGGVQVKEYEIDLQELIEEYGQ